MKKNRLLVLLLLLSTLSFAQVGIKTSNPLATLHVDGAKDNPASGNPNATQESNDVVVTTAGKLGVGTITPEVKMHIVATAATANRFNLIDVPAGTNQYVALALRNTSPLATGNYSLLGFTNNGPTSGGANWGIGTVRTGNTAINGRQEEFFIGNSVGGTYNERMRVNAQGNVGIGAPAPNPSALLELSSTTKGFLPTRLTTAQRDAINPKPEGLMIYNLDIHCMQYWNATKWVGDCDGSTPSPVIDACTAGLNGNGVLGRSDFPNTYQVFSGPPVYVTVSTSNVGAGQAVQTCGATTTTDSWRLGEGGASSITFTFSRPIQHTDFRINGISQANSSGNSFITLSAKNGSTDVTNFGSGQSCYGYSTTASTSSIGTNGTFHTGVNTYVTSVTITHNGRAGSDPVNLNMVLCGAITQ
ncbi:hypothetical protein ATE47_12830 [Chryseobacterium sp. IHB B 17019]|uniref:hypothetical protein n=1 Tax=Chryseobacterium sp. IHB B 17019 TaxID=1721091 RepID=UPI00071EE3A7|nr:hypothetical protein [Chryseobacterium sp. IHB B 17019]ALR31350.1 hypothetical protein ATE47_12830 [Chryseobacterium sp. IHB B 17019]